MSFWRKTFDEQHPNWRNYEDTKWAKEKNPNFDAFIEAHKGPNWRWSWKIKKYLSSYEPWVLFRKNKQDEIRLANELFNRFFLSKAWEGKYFPGPDHVQIRHLFIEISDKGILAIDVEGQILHEKIEMQNWIQMFGGIEKAWKVISEERAYDRYYDAIHSKAIDVEYGLYQFMGEKIINTKLPFKAFLYAHPTGENRGWPPIERMNKNFMHGNSNYLTESVTFEQIKLAADVFEIGGYRYLNKDKVVNVDLQNQWIRPI